MRDVTLGRVRIHRSHTDSGGEALRVTSHSACPPSCLTLAFPEISGVGSRQGAESQLQVGPNQKGRNRSLTVRPWLWRYGQNHRTPSPCHGPAEGPWARSQDHGSGQKAYD